MWNTIQARRPREAAKLANTAAVITYNSSAAAQAQPSPQQPQQEAFVLSNHVLEQLRVLGTAQVQSALPSNQTADPGLATLTPPVQSSSAGRGFFSRLATLGLSARRATDADSAAAQQAQPQPVTAAPSVSTPPAAASSANEALRIQGTTSLPNPGHGHERGAMTTSTDTAAQGLTNHAEELHARYGPGSDLARIRMRQSVVLRRAQAAFSDLRQASAGRHEPSVAISPG